VSLLKFRNSSGKSYRRLSREMGIHWSLIWRIIHRPELYSLKSILRVAKYIEMPEDEAKSEWEKKKLRSYKEKITSG
jgi:hypothetical protein